MLAAEGKRQHICAFTIHDSLTLQNYSHVTTDNLYSNKSHVVRLQQ